MIKVLDKLIIGGNTSITIPGQGDEVKIGEILIDTKGIEHKILSVAMVEYDDPSEVIKSTTLYVEGIWNE